MFCSFVLGRSLAFHICVAVMFYGIETSPDICEKFFQILVRSSVLEVAYSPKQPSDIFLFSFKFLKYDFRQRLVNFFPKYTVILRN